ncbi:MAG: sigma 54-interacting transcriptional regulator [Desulfosalsimonadaceae bacterium]
MDTKPDPAKYALAANATDIILESISEGVFTIDKNWRITSFNRAAEAITGVEREDAIGRHCWEVFRSDMCEADCALRRTMEAGTPVVNRSAYLVNSERRRIPITVSTAVLRDETGNVIGGVETFRDISQVEALRKELDGRYQLGDMVSRSPAMQKIFTLLPQIAASDSTVLIRGETGTGKELLARALHDHSSRRDKSFIAINCGALPDTLLESELFGYKAGAFTHAVKDKPGHFSAAHGGTLLLDEIGDISQAFQVKLLRVLQDQTFQPLGSTETIKTDVRVIAATHHDLSELVQQSRFRQDLYYRINVVTLALPPLRERKEDIPLLSERIVERMNRMRGRAVAGISQEALAVLMAYNFPGNIRELENIIEHAFILCPDAMILPAHLPEHLQTGRQDVCAFNGASIQSARRYAEAQRIIDALARNHYNRQATARELGIHKSTLYRKIKQLDLELPENDGRSQPGPDSFA